MELFDTNRRLLSWNLGDDDRLLRFDGAAQVPHDIEACVPNEVHEASLGVGPIVESVVAIGEPTEVRVHQPLDVSPIHRSASLLNEQPSSGTQNSERLNECMTGVDHVINGGDKHDGVEHLVGKREMFAEGTCERKGSSGIQSTVLARRVYPDDCCSRPFCLQDSHVCGGW